MVPQERLFSKNYPAKFAFCHLGGKPFFLRGTQRAQNTTLKNNIDKNKNNLYIHCKHTDTLLQNNIPHPNAGSMSDFLTTFPNPEAFFMNEFS